MSLLLIDLFNLWGKRGHFFSEINKWKSHQGKYFPGGWLEVCVACLPQSLATPLLAAGDTTLFPVTLFPLISPAPFRRHHLLGNEDKGEGA